MSTEEPEQKDEMEKQMEQEASGEMEFYDADEDDENERWFRQKQLNERYVAPRELPPTKKRSTKRVDFDDMAAIDRQKLEGDFGDVEFTTDALLSCPSCMVVLTRDCQRHEIFKDQYRAMFVENCTVDMSERLFVPQRKSKLVKRKTDGTEVSEKEDVQLTREELDKCDPSDIFFPVKCSSCKTQVGMYDHDEIYHLFNVLAGYS